MCQHVNCTIHTHTQHTHTAMHAYSYISVAADDYPDHINTPGFCLQVAREGPCMNVLAPRNVQM